MSHLWYSSLCMYLLKNTNCSTDYTEKGWEHRGANATGGNRRKGMCVCGVCVVFVCRGGGGNGVGGAKTEKEEDCKKENGTEEGETAEIGQVRQMEGLIGHRGALRQLFFDILVDTMT